MREGRVKFCSFLGAPTANKNLPTVRELKPPIAGDLNPRIDTLKTPDFSLYSHAVQTVHFIWYKNNWYSGDFKSQFSGN